MNIKSQKDFYSGLVFIAIGAAFAMGARNYTMGTAGRMGPAYFPFWLGVLLAVLGLAILVFSLTDKTKKDGDPIGQWAWRPLGFIVGSNIVFGILLGGLPRIGFPGLGHINVNIPSMGLVAGIFFLVSIAGMADKTNTVKDMVKGFLIAIPVSAFGLVVAKAYPKLQPVMGDAAFVVFSAALAGVLLFGFLHFLVPLIITRFVGNQTFKKAMIAVGALAAAYIILSFFQAAKPADFAKNMLFISELMFKIVLAIVIVFLVPKVATKVGIKDEHAVNIGLVISMMCFLSVWAFIDGLRLQFPLWPSFLMN